MDPPYSNFYLNLGDSEDYSNTQYYQNSLLFSNSSQVPVTENLPTTQNTEKQPRGTKWDVAEDVALMLAWCLASENSVNGKETIIVDKNKRGCNSKRKSRNDWYEKFGANERSL
ncbi:hypothetical protein HanXRQr2_Chr04g0156351 [Helianthus annuus]|uniref:Uncharacterized protein n=1 Tax=Helianthus annuus TaxID=4232 RepID=A0A251UZD3_HELAN|nr:hypothetical protein HanXRQr2_Chr04g0156351 [Helianthus annuus]KAJ0930528.1 hypothetical protein HanPSC8_Chr04g0150361 [Helianthus annuus]